jgi:hypothetical protein
MKCYFISNNPITLIVVSMRLDLPILKKNLSDLIIIDIDRSEFKREKGFKLALSTTLRNIREKLNGHPEIIWSGNGVHICQPIRAIIFENYEIFYEFNND